MSEEGKLHIGNNMSVKVEGDKLLVYFERAEEMLSGQSVNVEIFDTLEAWQVQALIKYYQENATPPKDEDDNQ